MSIQGLILEHLKERRIMHVPPHFGPQVRHVYATADVFRQLDAGTAEPALQEGSAALRGALDNFSRGNRMVVGARDSKTANLKILDKSQGVWEIRKRDTPSTRVFGFFVEHDCFMAIDVHLVSYLLEGNKGWDVTNWLGEKIREIFPNWQREIRNTKAIWRNLFLTYPPLTSETLSDYLSYASDERGL